MALPSTYAYVCIKWSLRGGKSAYVKLWFLPLGPIETDGEQTAADSIASSCKTNLEVEICNFMTTETSLDTFRAYVVTPSGTFVGTAASGLNGANAGDTAPNFVAAILQRRRAAPGKKGVGRIFIPGVPESFTDDNVLNTAGLDAIEELLAPLASEVNAGGVQWQPAFHSPKDATITPVTVWSRVPLLARMGSRKAR